MVFLGVCLYKKVIIMIIIIIKQSKNGQARSHSKHGARILPVYLTLKCQTKIKKGAAYLHIIEVFNGAVVGEDIYCSCYQGCHGSKAGWDDFVGVRFLQFHCD